MGRGQVIAISRGWSGARLGAIRVTIRPAAAFQLGQAGRQLPVLPAMWQSSFQFVSLGPRGHWPGHRAPLAVVPRCLVPGRGTGRGTARPQPRCSWSQHSPPTVARPACMKRTCAKIYERLPKNIKHMKKYLLQRRLLCLPVVDVLTVGARVGELLATFFALIRFVARVQPLVLHQVVFVLESFVASITGVGPVI